MAPVSKSSTTATWVRRPSRYLDDDNPNLEESSSGEETQPTRRNSFVRNGTNDRKEVPSPRKPSFITSSDAASSVNGRSYVDPWDMENYSFLRRQLEDISLSSDNDVSSTPAFESTQSDFYYVPLDGDGSPQYQYKQYVDGNGFREGFRDDTGGTVAGVDERHFFNDYLDPNQQSMYGSYNVLTNPSRQSERSRYNNQDYQTYTPPSIMKDFPSRYNSNKYLSLERSNYGTNMKPRAKKSNSELYLNKEIYGVINIDERWTDTMQSRRKSFSDAKASAINRRQSFQDVSIAKERRRRSALDDPFAERARNAQKDKISRRVSIHEIALPETHRTKPLRPAFRTRKDILATSQSVEDLARVPIDDLRRPAAPVPPSDSSLVYVYETARRRRKMVLPNTEMYGNIKDLRLQESDSDESIPTVRSETYSMRPLGRYAMSNYGHLKIDYSCSWNNLYRYVTDKVRA